MRFFALALVMTTAVGAAERGHWLRDHFTGELFVGSGGWRSSISSSDHAPGFDELGGGAELLLGLEVGSGFAIVGSGRVLAGDQYLEGLAGLGLQLHVGDRVRIRASPAAGQMTLKGDNGILVGGFVAGSIDLIPFGGGRVAATIGLRLDIDGVLGGGLELPDTSLSLAIGVGLRY